MLLYQYSMERFYCCSMVERSRATVCGGGDGNDDLGTTAAAQAAIFAEAMKIDDTIAIVVDDGGDDVSSLQVRHTRQHNDGKRQANKNNAAACVTDVVVMLCGDCSDDVVLTADNTHIFAMT